MNQFASNDWRAWYDQLVKPSWTPAPQTIGLIWQILYPIILVCFVFVLVQVIRGKYPGRVLIPFVVNLVANLIFTPVQFGLRNLPLASVDILIVWASIIWMILAVRKYNRWVAWAQLPYLVWVSIAMGIQFYMTLMNA